MVMMIDHVGIEEDGGEDRKEESTKLIVLRCYPTPSYDVEVDVGDDESSDDAFENKDKDEMDRSINIIVVRCESSPWASKLPFTSPRVVVEPRMIFQFF